MKIFARKRQPSGPELIVNHQHSPLPTRPPNKYLNELGKRGVSPVLKAMFIWEMETETSNKLLMELMLELNKSKDCDQTIKDFAIKHGLEIEKVVALLKIAVEAVLKERE